MERSADVLAAGLLEVADPSLSSKFFLRQVCFTTTINFVEFLDYLMLAYTMNLLYALHTEVNSASRGFSSVYVLMALKSIVPSYSTGRMNQMVQVIRF